MTTKTRPELVSQALANLGALQAGQTPADEDASTIDGYVEGMLARLSAKGIVTVSDDSEIPTEWFNSLADILADDAALEFGAAKNPQKVLLAENELRIMTRGQPTREVLTSEYF